MSNWSENTLKLFNEYWPSYTDKVIDQKEIGDFETVFTLTDGERILFDEMGCTLRFIHPIPPEQFHLFHEQWLKEFSRKVKKKMKIRRITQTELAEKLDISSVTVGRYVNGKRRPDYLFMLDLSNILNCDINEISNFWYLY